MFFTAKLEIGCIVVLAICSASGFKRRMHLILSFVSPQHIPHLVQRKRNAAGYSKFTFVSTGSILCQTTIKTPLEELKRLCLFMQAEAFDVDFSDCISRIGIIRY